MPSCDPGPERQALVNADRAMLRSAMATLTDDHRTVIRLRIIEGRSSREAAELMERSPDAVRQLQRRALAALRTVLREELPI